MKHLGDVTKVKGNEVQPVDIIVGGSPCQDLSVAGLRKGIQHEEHGDGETTRSGLAYEMFRIIKEMRNNGRADDTIRHPRFALWENVPGALSASAADGGKGTAFQCVLTEFIRCKEGCEEADLVPIPKDGWPNTGVIVFANGHASLAWRIVDLQYYGCPQRRKRISLLCDYDGLSAPSINFEQYPYAKCRGEVQTITESVSGDTNEGRTERKTSATDIKESTSGHG